MKNRSFFLLLISSLLLCSFGSKPGEGNQLWKILSMVKIKAKFDPITENFTNTYTISPKVKKLNGKRVTLTGNITSFYNEVFLLREDRYFGCCSWPGLHEMVRIKVDKITSFKTPQVVTLEGTLRISPTEHLYTLEDAVCLNCK